MAVLDILPSCVSSVYFMYDKEWEQFSFGKASTRRTYSLLSWSSVRNSRLVPFANVLSLKSSTMPGFLIYIMYIWVNRLFWSRDTSLIRHGRFLHSFLPENEIQSRLRSIFPVGPSELWMVSTRTIQVFARYTPICRFLRSNKVFERR